MLRLSQQEYERIDALLKSSELVTSAPIFIHFAHFCRADVTKSALKYFHKSALTHVADRNAVLIFISRANNKFSIIGDEAAHRVLSDDFWRECQALLSNYFKQSSYVLGLSKVVEKIASALAADFPAK
jgi:uncharacterized membrane protein